MGAGEGSQSSRDLGFSGEGVELLRTEPLPAVPVNTGEAIFWLRPSEES